MTPSDKLLAWGIGVSLALVAAHVWLYLDNHIGWLIPVEAGMIGLSFGLVWLYRRVR